ncbi:hypothetical protein [Olleya sp. 1-3]|uniref:hypothetical protein n=1 Tax=Olleya sp. 1-3 TaxID=2058323 RepID=UPI000C3336D7|nr:hypothetical protein [Olleya sp. 1-3]PKG51862.1 hypothetical protein CXF54_07650 [Olleya sp. 1-3]
MGFVFNKTFTFEAHSANKSKLVELIPTQVEIQDGNRGAFTFEAHSANKSKLVELIPTQVGIQDGNRGAFTF